MTSPSFPPVDAKFLGGFRRWTRVARRLASKFRGRFVVVGALLVVGIALGGWTIASMERDASFVAYETSSMNLTRGAAAQTEQMLGAVDRLLMDVSAALALADAATPDEIKEKLRAPAMSQLLSNRQVGSPGVVALMLIDAAGRLRAGSRDGWAEGFDVSGRDFFLGARASAGSYVGAPLKDAATGASFGYIARRLNGRGGAFVGVAVAKIRLSDLENFYRVATPPQRFVTLMKDDGTLLVQFPHRLDLVGKRALGLASHPLGSTEIAPYHGADLIDGKPVVAAAARIENLPLVIESSVPEGKAMADWNRQTRGLTIACIAAAVVVLELLRKFATQVRRLEASERSLETAHRQLDIALSNIPQGVCFFDSESRLVVSNRRYCEVYGMAADSARPGDTLAEIVERRYQVAGVSKVAGMTRYDHAEYLRFLQDFATSGSNGALVELADGRIIAIQSQPMPEGGWVATHEDVTERRRTEERIAFLAKHDALTRLPNRALLMERIADALRGYARGKLFGILFLDLDRFKAVNDTLGHNVGDDLLRHVAARLTGTVRHGCTVARLGGDEFVVLQLDVDTPEDCATLARRILDTVAAPYKIGEHEIVIGVSVGIDVASPEGDSAEVLLKHADLALYRSKSSGRGAFRFFEPEMDSEIQNRRRLELDLRRAVDERQFELHYQPVIDAACGEVCSFEALLRWNHPSRGMVAPGEFIALAEETGLIIPIGEWVIAEACRQAATWPERIRIAVNVSAVQFRSGGLIPVIQEALSNNGLAPQRLEIEITETVLLQSNERNLAILHQLRDLGVGIAMDDFGVGYSSMSYLTKFRFDRLKIDRSFVGELTKKSEAVFFVRAIVDLCRNLGIKTTAEGVETLEQLSILLEEDCTQLQGYLFGRPSPAQSAQAFLVGGALIPWQTRRRSPPSTAARRMGLAS